MYFLKLTTRGQKNVKQAYMQQNSQHVLLEPDNLFLVHIYVYLHQVTITLRSLKCLVCSVRVSRISEMLRLLQVNDLINGN